jgi:hypothetical protein
LPELDEDGPAIMKGINASLRKSLAVLEGIKICSDNVFRSSAVNRSGFDNLPRMGANFFAVSYAARG